MGGHLIFASPLLGGHHGGPWARDPINLRKLMSKNGKSGKALPFQTIQQHCHQYQKMSSKLSRHMNLLGLVYTMGKKLIRQT